MFKTIPHLPEDSVLGLVAEFKAMSHPSKVNLGVGIYQTNEGVSKVFEAVRLAEKELLGLNLNKNYLPIEGDPLFIRGAAEVILGPQFSDPTIFSCQAVGGTSALFTGGRLLKEAGIDTIFLPNPTWPNHPQIFNALGFKLESYDYPSLKGLENASENSAVILHASCHNPTGIDLSQKEWLALFDRLKNQGAILFFDNAYQGFNDGLEADAWALREAVSKKYPCLIASSFSKNMGLYGERLGLLTLHCPSESDCQRLLSFVKLIIRTTYSNPPLHAARVAAHIFSSPSLSALWKGELEGMRLRLKQIRKELASVLPTIEHEAGLFSLTGFSPQTVQKLKEDFGILMLKTGRINLSGINDGNRAYVIEAFRSVI